MTASDVLVCSVHFHNIQKTSLVIFPSKVIGNILIYKDSREMTMRHTMKTYKSEEKEKNEYYLDRDLDLCLRLAFLPDL